MAFWGAPALLEDHAWRACVAALRIQRGMDALNARWQAEGTKPLQACASASIATPCWSAISARKERMSYTVMGDGVNIAARLEGINKEFGTRICISHSRLQGGRRAAVRAADRRRHGQGPPRPDPDLRAAGRLRRRRRSSSRARRRCGWPSSPGPRYAALVAARQRLARCSAIARCSCEFPDDPVAQVMVKRLAAERHERRIRDAHCACPCRRCAPANTPRR